MRGDRFHAPGEIPFRRQQAHNQPALPGKTKETARMYHHRSLQQELERGFFFGPQPGNTEYGIPTRLDVQPGD